MRRKLPGKVVMAAIILSCGMVMHAEQAEQAARPQRPDRELTRRDVAFNSSTPKGLINRIPVQRPGPTW